MTRESVPVLTYHSIDTTGSVISVGPDVFRAQMKSLSKRGFTGIRADQLIAAWNGTAELPARPVVLTFDDGFANFGEVVVPSLVELGFRATVYVIADLANKTNDWRGQPAHIPRLPLLSWDAIASIAAAGFEIGGHTATHPDLRFVSGAALEHEIGASKRTIAERAGASVTTFAYPYGSISREAHDIARRNYGAAFGTVLGTARLNQDRYQLPRIDMYYYRNPAAFRHFGTMVGASYIGLRAFGRTARDLLQRRLRASDD
jgi:peptidoglycan/xylan/chitin deacetylase (PgdA/CDA1 family)